MTGRGRPLRFLALVTGLWIGVRVMMLWPQAGSLPAAIRALAPLAPLAAARDPSPAILAAATAPEVAGALTTATAPRGPLPVTYAPLPDSDPRVQMALLGLIQYGRPETVEVPVAALPPAAIPAGPDRLDPLPDRWSASAWLVARGGMGRGVVPGGQIGGSQAGGRVAWLVSPRLRLAAFARVAGPLSGPGREGAIGLEWQPSRAPVRLVAEQRFGLDGGPNGTGLGVIAGGEADLRGFRLEAYGQAGAIARRRVEPYADGAARGTRSVVASGAARLALGAGAWGAAQRDAQRLDVGPSATLSVRNLRFALDWRQRVAGGALPGSGLALSLGADF